MDAKWSNGDKYSYLDKWSHGDMYGYIDGKRSHGDKCR